MKKLIKILFIITTFYVLTISAQTASVIVENANLRGTPSEYGKVVDTISQGTSLEVIKQRGVWFLVQTLDYVGWMHGNTIRYRSGNTSNKTPAKLDVLDFVPSYSVPTRRSTTPSRIYIRGRRGGCYYINSNGNKTYVDRSLCN